MREIKFRAWNKVQNFMDTAWLIDWEHDLVCHRAHNQSDLNDCVLMQYTGLKVNGGIDLYEGDIVPVKSSVYFGWKQGREHFKTNAVVVYDEKEMRYRFLAYTKDYGKQYVDFDKAIRQSYKIIGNIYENPELLEEK